MTDEEIANQIAKQCGLAVCFSLMARFATPSKARHLTNVANQITAHCIRLITTHRAACERWMLARGAQPTWIATEQ